MVTEEPLAVTVWLDESYVPPLTEFTPTELKIGYWMYTGPDGGVPVRVTVTTRVEPGLVTAIDTP